MMPKNSRILRSDDTGETRRAHSANHPTLGNENPGNGTIIVLGATERVGRGVVRAALETGRPVVAVAGELRQLEQLRVEQAGSNVTVLATTIAGDTDGERLAAMLRMDGRPVVAVVDAMSGDTGRGRLIDHPIEVLRRTLDKDLLPHLAAARHLIPLLGEAKRGGSYLIIGGPGSEAPWSNYGFRSVAAAALRMLACVLHDEARSFDVRLQMLLVAAPVRGDVACRHAVQLVGLRDAPVSTDAAPALVAAAARAVVRHVTNVESADARTTTQRRTYTDVQSFLNDLISQDRNEVSRDDTP